MFKIRNLIKALIIVPVVWILVILFIGFNDNGASPGQLKSQKERIRILKERNDELIADAARQNLEKKIAAEKADDHLKEDHDHPEEERLKAQEQQKEQAGPIQVHAPQNNNPNEPGLFISIKKKNE